jgi:hypothetical protein
MKGTWHGDDLRRLKCYEHGFIPVQITVPTLSQLKDSIDASYKDAESCEKKEEGKAPDCPALNELFDLGRLHVVFCSLCEQSTLLVDSNGVFDREDDEKAH